MAEGGPGSTGDVVAALRAVGGVADASITPDHRSGGAGTLHLSLLPGADEVAVATAVNRILREHFGLAVDTDNVSVVDATEPVRLSAVPAPPEQVSQGPPVAMEWPSEPSLSAVPDPQPQAAPSYGSATVQSALPDAPPEEPMQPIEAAVAADPWSSYQPERYGVDPSEAEEPLELESERELAPAGGPEQSVVRPWWAGAPADIQDAEPHMAGVTQLPTRPQEPALEAAVPQDAAPAVEDEVTPDAPDQQTDAEASDQDTTHDTTHGTTQQSIEIEDDSEEECEPSPRGPRLLIERMQLVTAGLGVETEVTLGYGAQRWTGRAEAAATPTSVHRSVAIATLRAVEECVGGPIRFELEHLETPPLGVDRAVVVEISMITRRGAERLTGVSAIREDVRQAVIRATLDAINRRLESHLLSA